MITDLFAAMTKDLATVARAPGFFEQAATARLASAVSVLGEAYPRAALQYLEGVSSTDFVADVRTLLPMLQTGRLPEEGIRYRAFFAEEPKGFGFKDGLKQAPLQTRAPLPSDTFLDDLERYLLGLLPQNEKASVPNGLVQALFSSVSEEIADWCDSESLPPDIRTKTELGRLLNRLVEERRLQGLLQEVAYRLFREFGVVSAIVQSPVPLEPETKRRIRLSLRTAAPTSIPRFMVEPTLLGGVRILSQAGLQDYSWVSLVSRLTSTQPTH